MRGKILVLILFFSLALHAKVITIAEYNLQNFNTSDRVTEGIWRQNYPKPEKEKAALIEVITHANPDILVMEEMGGEEYLAELQTRLRAAGVHYPYRTIVPGGDPTRRLAALSKIKFTARYFGRLAFNYAGKRESSLRGLLQMEFLTDDQSWRIYGVHLKSRITSEENKWDAEAEKFRVAEANALREQILRMENLEGAYLVTGDFNDNPRSSALRRFLTKGDKTLTVMITPLDSHGEVWTHRWESQGSYSRIDYFLASPAMLPALLPNSARIIDIPAAANASDHRMICVAVDIGAIGITKTESKK